MRQLLLPILTLSAALFGSGCNIEAKVESPAIPNEVKPNDNYWGKEFNGLQQQVTVLRPSLRSSDTSLPVIIWFRNPSKEIRTLRTIQPLFTPHHDIDVLGPDGTSIIEGECFKKHVIVEVPFQPGQVRGFWCDAFNQWCYRRKAGHLAPGRYTVRVAGGSNDATFEVTE